MEYKELGKFQFDTLKEKGNGWILKPEHRIVKT